MSNAIEMIEQLNKTVLARVCPLTAGGGTKLTMATFKRMCSVKQDEMRVYEVDGHRRLRSKPVGLCGKCMGRKVPAEIEIIPLGELVHMGTGGDKLGKCELCGSKGALRRNHNLMACAKCQAMQGAVSQRPDVVVKALKLMVPPERLAELVGESVAVEVESDVLARIAAAVGYSGTGGEGLVAAVEMLMADYRSMEVCGILQPSFDLRRALDLPEEESSWMTVEISAMQVAAQLEDRERSGAWARTEGEQVLRMRDLLGLPMAGFKGLVDQVEWLVDRVHADDDHEQEVLSTAAEINGLKDQVVAIRTALGGTDTNFDILRAIVEMAQTLDRYKSHCERLTAERLVEPPVYAELHGTGKSIESYILDLSLMALRGEIIGLDPAFISTMREAV